MWCAGTDTAGDAGAIVTPGGREGVRWTTTARFMWLVTTTVAGAERPGPTTTGALALTVIGPRTEIVAVALRSPAPSIPAEESCAVRLLTSPSACSGAVTRKLRVVLCPGRQREHSGARQTDDLPPGREPEAHDAVRDRQVPVVDKRCLRDERRARIDGSGRGQRGVTAADRPRDVQLPAQRQRRERGRVADV